jgi:uridine monophosphate synthetase
MEKSKYIQSLKNVIFSKLIHLGMIKTGSFTLKNGTQSNVYMDMRQLVNYPHVFAYLTKLLYLEYPQLLAILSHPNSKLIPIPLGGLPLGFNLAYDKKIPLLMIRDKAKDHGTKKLIEGVIEPSDQYILIEDVITSGSSIIQTLDNISNHVTTTQMSAIICICNRGGLETLHNIPIYSIFTLAELQEYISNYLVLSPSNNTSYFQYGTTFSNKLYQLALVKQSNLILSCDFMTNQEILECLHITGKHIIAVKLHLDILESSSYSQFITGLNILKDIYNFLVIEDAKYADIDSIMIEKINHSQLAITKVADAFTMHAIAGLSILEGDKLGIPGIVVAEMSSSNTIITTEYTRKIVNTINNTQDTANDIANDTATNVASMNMLGGIVCQTQIPQQLEPFQLATMSPGINLDITHDSYNQQYKIPNLADDNKVGLFWIVGRGITKYKNNTEKLQEIINKYQSKGWDYFIKY